MVNYSFKSIQNNYFLNFFWLLRLFWLLEKRYIRISSVVMKIIYNKNCLVVYSRYLSSDHILCFQAALHFILKNIFIPPSQKKKSPFYLYSQHDPLGLQQLVTNFTLTSTNVLLSPLPTWAGSLAIYWIHLKHSFDFRSWF